MSVTKEALKLEEAKTVERELKVFQSEEETRQARIVIKKANDMATFVHDKDEKEWGCIQVRRLGSKN